jgi:hypothetical protein
VTVTAIKAGYQTEVLRSTATATVVAGTFATPPKPTIYGTKQVGRALSIDVGEWADDVVLTYAWKWSGTTTTVGTASRYTPVAGDVGKKLTVTVTGALPGYTNAFSTSVATTAIVAGIFALAPVPTISGIKKIGNTLTAITGTWTSGATFAYSWKRSGSTTTISTAARYTPVTADIGKTLTVTVKATRTGFTTLSKISVATTAVLGVAFTASPVPTITGTASSGSVLTAVTTGWEPNTGVTFTYVWKRASTSSGTKTVIAGATKSTYKLVTADKSKFITVTVTARKTGYESTTRVSADGGTQVAR